MRFVLTTDAEEFADRVTALIESRLECNVLATVLANMRDGIPEVAPVFAYGLDGDHGEPRFAALRSPPWPMLASELESGAASQFIAEWLDADPTLPGVNGLPQTARAIAAAWSEQTGGTTRCRMREAMHVLEEVRDPPRPADGELRLPRPEERRLLVEWTRAFGEEAGMAGAAAEAETIVDFRLARERLPVWDHNGPVSMVGSAGPVAGVARIGPVYTPPEQRNRGYAGTAVAALSRHLLAHGASRCALFTDIANPTSNKIYAEVGYRRIGDWEEYEFERA